MNCLSRRLLSALFIGLLATTAIAQPAATKPPAAPQTQLPVNEVRTFVDILDHIKNSYVEKIDDTTLLEKAIKGMLNELDPHSAYLDLKDFDNLRINTSGQFGGLGLEVGMENGFIKIISPIDDTPAQKAGIRAGDTIVKIDGKPIKGTALDDAVAMMRGKVGSKIKLTLIREGVHQPIELTLVRAVIKVQSVKSRLLEPHYGYIRLSQFQEESGKEVANALKKLNTKENPLNGLVLDLRNNPGGILQSAVAIADLFLNNGLIVYTKGRLPDSDLKFSATPGDLLNGAPLIVLINGGSASASEILAGALQDQHRAIIMGTTSFGKGSVQTVLPLTNGKALKLTTALYYTPSGRSIQAKGIVPDVRVDAAKVTKLNQDNGQYTEADLPGHLANGNAADPTTKTQSPNAPIATDKAINEDYQLFEALSLLKALHTVKASSRAP